ncbi:tripartite tricarboxylate transporter substrate binding protein [Siccirubricoccus sp. G192]|uniref:Bug family tripartite tricarboxylate transporter substrate binding protein n=1 Tax=Siccirubricoccus sp. G192 TaxID=2849651 RepID=UPI001C2CA27A|nr:tripartite tricarboxylate transporter substrate binding protein [Siccirubricoccus sp. G192]MBV1799751.1 tripartite tricarboxylate transporter substrate binding protein [Siccirubricoccus sp. G192]
MPATRRRLLTAALTLPCILPRGALAQAAWPARPVRVLVGFPPGGGVDIVARLLMPKLAERLGQPFLVENRAGANGNIAMEAAVKAPADGYTLFYGNVGNLGVTNALYRDLSFDTLRDFAPVAQTMESSLVIAVADAVPVRSLADLLGYARANPGRLNAGSAGAGGPSHLALELFKRQAGLDIIHVPYRGSAPAVQDLAGGRVQMLIDGYSLMRGAVESGRARVLAVAAAERQAILPAVPTATEAGLPGFEAGSWHALVAPANTPPAVLRRLEAAVEWALRETDLPQAFAGQGVAARFRNAAETRAFIAAERERWGGVVREAGITLE